VSLPKAQNHLPVLPSHYHIHSNAYTLFLPHHKAYIPEGQNAVGMPPISLTKRIKPCIITRNSDDGNK
jgi:hypothetical protein